MSGRRYNKGKLRYELISNIGLERIAEVYTKGAEKYTLYNEDGSVKDDGANNWKNGFSWMDTIGSVERHIQSWKKGEDFDPELKTRHLANAAWGLIALLEFEKTHPELDDRWKPPTKRIGLDIDDVCASFVPAYCKKYNLEIPNSWYLDYNFIPRIQELVNDEDFWLNLNPLFNPNELLFEPSIYITARDERLKEFTNKWLEKNNFPKAPVVFSRNKGEVCKEFKLDLFIDDSPKNFEEINNSGTCCFLMDTVWNRYKNVGYRRIHNVNDII